MTRRSSEQLAKKKERSRLPEEDDELEGDYNEEEWDDDADDEGYVPSPKTVVNIRIRNPKTKEWQIFSCLLDTGTNRNLGTVQAARRAGLKLLRDVKVRQYDTAAGRFSTSMRARIRSHSILELNSRRVLQPMVVRMVEGHLGNYDFIFGRDYLSRYGINLMFEDKTIRWDGLVMPMKESLTFNANEQPVRDENDVAYDELHYYPMHHDVIAEKIARELLAPYSELNRDEIFAQQILDSTYAKSDLPNLCEKQEHLNKDERQKLLSLLKRHEGLLQGQLGEWPGVEIDLELLPEATPYHCKRYIRIPHIHMETLKKEINRLIKIGVIEELYDGEAGPWCAPSFIIPKKDNKVRFITDFRELNRRIRRKPWPMPHVMDLIQDIGSYDYVTAIDLSMGFYHFRMSDEASEMTTFMLPFGIYKYRRLPMGLSISPDIFQGHMYRLFAGDRHVKVYMDDILVFTKGDFNTHVQHVDAALKKLQSKNMAVNAEKTYWAVDEVDYLGFRLTKQGILPQPKKVAAITSMLPPTGKKMLRRFIGLVNYYRYMWKKRSDLLTPLTELTGKNIFKWEDKHQRAFEAIKAAVGKEVMLSFPDYNVKFELYTDASKYQMGAVLMQGDKTIAFFSRKLNSAQCNYGAGEREMLSVVEALKEFKTIIFGYPIDVYTDHKNWTHDKILINERVMRWRLAIEDFAPSFHYIKGSKNVVADTLSRMPFQEVMRHESFNIIEENFDLSPMWRRFQQPVTLAAIAKAQEKDPDIQHLRRTAPDKLGEFFEDIGKKSGPDKVITAADVNQQSRILVPKSIRHRLLRWYHETLVHPGINRMYNTMRQHYTWPGMLKQIKQYVTTCDSCQRGKRGGKGYSEVPIKDPEVTPWKDVAVDLSGPWTATIDKEEVVFNTLTIIDVFTGWVEIIPIHTKKSENIADIFTREWLRRYPRPSRIIFDMGSEFDCEAFQTVLLNWYIKPEGITVKNPRANSIVERMHQVLGDMLRVQLTRTHKYDDPVADMTSAAAYAIRATVHGTTKYSPSQLVYAKDMILRTNVEASVENIRQRREQAIYQNNLRENKRRIKYKYHVGDKILVLTNRLDPKLKLHQGPYKVLSYDKHSGTLHIQRRNYVEPINVRNVRPYFGRPTKSKKD